MCRVYLEELKIKELDKEVEAELPEKIMILLREDENIEKVAKEILEAMAQEEFINAKHINYELQTYAMEIIDKEESRMTIRCLTENTVPQLILGLKKNRRFKMKSKLMHTHLLPLLLLLEQIIQESNHCLITQS